MKSALTVFKPSAPFLSRTTRSRWTEAVDVRSDAVAWQELAASQPEAIKVPELAKKLSIYSYIGFFFTSGTCAIRRSRAEMAVDVCSCAGQV